MQLINNYEWHWRRRSSRFSVRCHPTHKHTHTSLLVTLWRRSFRFSFATTPKLHLRWQWILRLSHLLHAATPHLQLYNRKSPLLSFHNFFMLFFLRSVHSSFLLWCDTYTSHIDQRRTICREDEKSRKRKKKKCHQHFIGRSKKSESGYKVISVSPFIVLHLLHKLRTAVVVFFQLAIA